VDSFSINLGKRNIQALVNAAKLGVNLDAPGSLEKFFFGRLYEESVEFKVTMVSSSSSS
jgi:hypothetical protein